MEQASNGEKDLRELLCVLGNRLWQRQLVSANDGNLSVRLDAFTILCTPSGVSKGFLQPEDLVVTDNEGVQIGGERKASSELKMHVEIYRGRGDINSVIHAHPPHATAFAVAGKELPLNVMPEIDVLLGRVPVIGYETPGTQRLAEAVGHVAGQAGTSTNAYLMKNHGAVTCGRTLEEAWLRMESLDHCCRILLLAQQVGGWKEIPADLQGELAKLVTSQQPA